MEMKYGGRIVNVPRNKVSPNDPRTPEQLATGGMVGGDRMFHHGYASVYARHLLPYVQSRKKITLVEFGILKGTGLAIWSDLFPGARIIGFDIDLGHIQANMEHLKKRGAFRNSVPELHEYDQFVENQELLAKILRGGQVDVCIDDGFHSNKTILTTLKSIMPSLSDGFVYFIEDNDQVAKELIEVYSHLSVRPEGELTVIVPQGRP